MKHYLAIVFSTAVFMYLIGSFVAATFYLPDWSETLRGVIAFVYVMTCFLFAPIALPDIK